MNERYIVTLTQQERERLETLVRGGSALVRDVKRAQILLAADKDISDGRIAAAVRVGTATVYRAKRRFVEGGVDHAIHDNPRPGAGRKLNDKQEALLIATACSKPLALDIETTRQAVCLLDRARRDFSRNRASTARRKRPQALAAKDVVRAQRGR